MSMEIKSRIIAEDRCYYGLKHVFKWRTINIYNTMVTSGKI